MTKKILFISLIAFSFLHSENITYQQHVKVTSSVGEYETVIESTPTQECWDERVPVTYYENNNYRQPQRNDAAAAIIGGVAGGVLGHQFGGGRGKDVATVGGAILGSLVGQNMSAQNQQQQYHSQPQTRYETKRRCDTRYTERKVRNFVGYKNIGYYKGKKIVKYSSQKLSRIPITVTISY